MLVVSNAASHRVLVAVWVGIVLAGLAGCGGSSTRTSTASGQHSQPSAQEKTKAADLFIVGRDCERSGASAMLKGSEGADTLSVPDDTSAVCGCWIRWMAESLPAGEVIQMYASLDGTRFIPVTMKALGGVVQALQSCDLGKKLTPAPASSAATGERSSSTEGTTKEVHTDGSASAQSAESEHPQAATHSARVPSPPGVTGTACSGRFEDDGDPTSGRGSWADVIASGLPRGGRSRRSHLPQAAIHHEREAPSALAGGLKCHTGEFRPPGDRTNPWVT